MKVGDVVRSSQNEGKIISFQPKTRDIIVKDEDGIIHIFLASMTELVSPRGTAFSMEKCTLCYDFGYRQIYQGGRVERVFCDCVAGQKNKKKIEDLRTRSSVG